MTEIQNLTAENVAVFRNLPGNTVVVICLEHLYFVFRYCFEFRV
jgi:hypothetical protein